MPGILLSINTSGGGVPKLPRAEARVGTLGVEGDDQRNRRLHGGPDRAVCLYSFDRIRALRAEGHPVSVGSTGENLTVMGVDWEHMTPGTRVTVGEVRLSVTGFTVPCRNLSTCFEGGRFGRVSQKTHPGWSRVYARVERSGRVAMGDEVRLDGPGARNIPGRQFQGLSITRTGTLDVACAPGEALVYFTPDGERLWVPGFDPYYLHPLSGAQGPGTIFSTTQCLLLEHLRCSSDRRGAFNCVPMATGGEDTLWMVTRFSPADGVAEYTHITPGSHRGTVRVALEATGPASSRATVSYDLAALSDAGDRILASMTEPVFAAMLAAWQRRIARTVGGRETDNH